MPPPVAVPPAPLTPAVPPPAVMVPGAVTVVLVPFAPDAPPAPTTPVIKLPAVIENKVSQYPPVAPLFIDAPPAPPPDILTSALVVPVGAVWAYAPVAVTATIEITDPADRLAAIAVVTNNVFAISVLLSPKVAVGAVAEPVKLGLMSGAVSPSWLVR